MKHFPNDRFVDLLFKGFINYGQAKSPYPHLRYNVRNILIAILLHGGGLRLSEPFHLFVQDIEIDPDNLNSALVRLYHPELGRAPDDYKDPVTAEPIRATREEYLRVKYGRLPRNQLVGSEHAGWKNLLLTDVRAGYALVYWFPSWWGEVFLSFFKLYIRHLRPPKLPHPYLFINLEQATYGRPYTLGQYAKAHARAVRRIGLEPTQYRGTTPHGHRHAYGQRLTDCEVDPLVRQRALHHQSLESQQPYTARDAAKVNAILQEATGRLTGELPPAVWQELITPLTDVAAFGSVADPDPLSGR